MSRRDVPQSHDTAERQGRYRRGLSSELIAAAFLIFRGYWIEARRFRSNAGEIDLIARKGRLIAFVEVKRRRDVEAAESAIAPRQRQRIMRAADLWIAQNQRFADYDRRFDIIFALPRRLPRHIAGGL